MITVIAEYTAPKPITNREMAREVFLSTTPKYKGMSGLIRKYYFIGADGLKAGGIYLWQSREDADRLYTEEWKAYVRNLYGCEPTLTYLDTPVIVDNLSNEVISD
jgi:uncharacterized lipoprotein YehR (DUF1307 family)